MIIKMISIALVALRINSHNPNQAALQIFDVKQEKVIKQSPLSSDLQESIMQLLQSSPAIYGNIDMNPKSGLILHVQFDKPVKLSSAIYPDLVKEVYFFLEPGLQPKSLMFFQSTKKFIVVVLKGDSNKFITQNNLP
ncbi:hypothetical protein [Cohnella thailandensis]|uniref:Uncharacterized protein n=1 Tax=Cohnella thailandensis TaxID=557557 RepID=A0A841T5R6_9BACL|nr:hypothetical protein [Cohnella thailandensis]MBB6638299.1 hypothetical protein [Cohnella thailandensis]MBP1977222.1 hypothetical protein [Cohnella thailandensis]